MYSFYESRSKEIEFTVPPAAFPLTPPRSRRGNPQMLDIASRNEPAGNNSEHASSSLGNPLAIGSAIRQRRFSSALLFPGRADCSPSLLLHCSAPTSPVPPCTPSPSHSPCLSPLPSVNQSISSSYYYYWILLITIFACA